MKSWLLIPTLLALSSTSFAGDWPQWLGPNRDGSSNETVKVWTGEPAVVWRAKVGEGHSSPVVAHGKAYLHHLVREGDKNLERLTAFDAVTGKELGSVSHERAKNKFMFGDGPRATPLVEPHAVYTLGINGLLCRESIESSEDGKISFSTNYALDTLKEYGAKNLYFGISSSPVIVGDTLIFASGGSESAPVVGINKATGKDVWRTSGQPASYAAPVVWGEGPHREVIFLGQKGLASVSPVNGKLNWEFPFKDKLTESSTTPVRAGDLLIASSVTLGSVALKMTHENGTAGVKEVWRDPKLTCYFSTPVPAGHGLLFMVTGVASLNKASITLHCVEAATGKVKWSKEKIGKYHAAILRTGDGKLLMLDDGGYLTLMEPSPDSYQELARSKVCGETWAHPALANGRLYIRDNQEIICLKMD